MRQLIGCALLLGAVALGQDVQSDPTTRSALDGRPVVAIIGQSNAVGRAAALTPAHPAVVLVENGAQLAAHPPRTGLQPGLSDRLSMWEPPVLVTEAEGGKGIAWVIDSVDRLAGSLERLELAPDVVVVVHGERDARSAGEASAYAGQLAALMGRLRDSWPGVLIYIVEVRYEASEDVLGLVSGDQVVRRNLQVVRAAQHAVCAADRRCRLIQSDAYELADASHYSSRGYYELGWAIAGYGRLDGVW
jgi:Carbohydrate esterase, sialic acid-specific acetylesterase